MVYFTDSIHKYTDYPLFGVMYTHAHTRYTRQPCSSGLESRLVWLPPTTITAQRLQCDEN